MVATTVPQPMLNAMTVDVEDYFQVEAFASRIPYGRWDDYTPRVERNVNHILELFARHAVSATFFVLGWVAERFPRLVRRIADAGHEVGCHGFAHRRLDKQTPEPFRSDLREAKLSIQNQIQRSVDCYRAPSFSIVRKTLWAFDILAEEGFAFDSSVFPIRHDNYGIPDANRFPHWHVTRYGNAIFEFPPSSIRYWKNNWGVAGGGYLRFAPYRISSWALQHINENEKQPAMIYFHPWELDPDQPRIRAGWRSTVRHYTNLTTMSGKIERLLREFRFTTLTQASQQLAVFHSRQQTTVESSTGLSGSDASSHPVGHSLPGRAYI
jgi:polysaccharide deacetylase family protein (PEP-CTERM system associated)